MLRHLHIENYALIDHLDITLREGFTVITGETGAGKSILLGAINLLLGQRADTKHIKAGATRCVIEADFTLGEEEYTIRRVLSDNGRSRVFINDEPAAVADLKDLGDRLIDIHSQHQNLLLGNKGFQLQVLDTLASNLTLLQSYTSQYRELTRLQAERQRLLEAQATASREQDYMQFQFDQLEAAALTPGEQDELEAEQRTLEHAEDIKSALGEVTQVLDGDRGALSALHTASRRLASVSTFFTQATTLADRLESTYIELKDILGETEDATDSVDDNPRRLEEVSARLSLIYDLQRKHNVATIDELIAIQQALDDKLAAITGSDEAIRALEQQIISLTDSLTQQATVLTTTRTKAARQLETAMCERLKPLGMPNIQFAVDIAPTELSAMGADSVTFAFSANKATPLQPIATTASGGEIARIMLSLKAIIATATALPTIIFDEIDTGVSGHIAEAMAHIMQDMAQAPGQQVISITHLPQIAARGAHHLRVFKTDTDSATATHIEQLTPESRLTELAHMLSGANITQAALDNARDLLSQ